MLPRTSCPRVPSKTIGATEGGVADTVRNVRAVKPVNERRPPPVTIVGQRDSKARCKITGRGERNSYKRRIQGIQG